MQIGSQAQGLSNNVTVIAYHSPQVEDEDNEEHHVPALSVGDRTVLQLRPVLVLLCLQHYHINCNYCSHSSTVRDCGLTHLVGFVTSELNPTTLINTTRQNDFVLGMDTPDREKERFVNPNPIPPLKTFTQYIFDKPKNYNKIRFRFLLFF